MNQGENAVVESLDSQGCNHSMAEYSCIDNSTLSYPPDWHGQDPHNYLGRYGAIVIVLEIFAGSLGNLLVIVAVVTTKTLRKSYNVFIVTLAVTDILFTTLVMPVYIESFVRRAWLHGMALCKFNTYLGVVLEIASVLQISAIAFHRYLLIVHPQQYKHFSSWPKMAALMVLICIFSTLVILPNVFKFDGRIAYTDQLGRCNYVRANSKGTLYWLFCATYIPAGVFIVFCYIGIINAVKKSKARLNNAKLQCIPKSPSMCSYVSLTPIKLDNSNAMKTGTTTCAAESTCTPDLLDVPNNTTSLNNSLEHTDRTVAELTEQCNLSISEGTCSLSRSPTASMLNLDHAGVTCRTTPHQHTQAFRMILVIFAAFVITYMPYTVVNLADVYGCFSRASYMMSSLFFWMGACVNPWIYGAMNSNFYQAYKSLLLQCCKRSKAKAWI